MNIINIGYRSTNYYVLADSAPRLLVDAGWPGTLGQMQHECSRMGIALASIPYQLVTHYHPDHAGLAQELKRMGVRLIVVDTQLEGIPLLRGYVKPRDNYVEIELEGNTLISVDESRAFLAGIGIQGEIISTPGHSDDSVTLVLDEGAAFTGDLTATFAVPDDPTDLAYQSWELIRARGVKRVYPGHGPVGHIESRCNKQSRKGKGGGQFRLLFLFCFVSTLRLPEGALDFGCEQVVEDSSGNNDADNHAGDRCTSGYE